jgi:hypothetical protein
VVDPLLHRLDVPVEHRHVRAQPEPVREAVDVQIAIGAALVAADLLPHALGKDLGAAAGQRIEARVHQLTQDLRVGHVIEIREERDLDRGETLQVNARPYPLEAAQQVRVVAERQIRVQPVDDVQLGERLVGTLAQLVPGLFERHRVRLGHAGLESREGAEQAARLADVGRLEPEVVVEVGPRPVTLLALAIGEPADGEQIGCLEQPDAVLEREAFSLLQLPVDAGQPGRANA